MEQRSQRKALELRIWELEKSYNPHAPFEPFEPKRLWTMWDLEEYEQVLICDQSTRGPKPWFGFPVEPPKLVPVPPRTSKPSSEPAIFDCPAGAAPQVSLKIL